MARSARRQRDRRIGAVFKLDGHEDHLVIADIFQIVNCEITLAYSAVPYLVGLVGPFDRRSILYMHASAAAGNRDPKVIQHVTMEAKAVARGKPDDLHWVWLLQRTGTRLGLFRDEPGHAYSS